MWSPDLTTAVEKFKGRCAPSSMILVAPMHCLVGVQTCLRHPHWRTFWVPKGAKRSQSKSLLYLPLFWLRLPRLGIHSQLVASQTCAVLHTCEHVVGSCGSLALKYGLEIAFKTSLEKQPLLVFSSHDTCQNYWFTCNLLNTLFHTNRIRNINEGYKQGIFIYFFNFVRQEDQPSCLG